VDDVLVNVTLKEALTGATKLAMVLDKKKCAACAGVGMRCESCATCAGRRVDASGKPCAACGGRGFGAPKPCAACHSKGAVEDFFQGRVVVPAGVANGARVRVAGKKQRAKIRIMPSKLFERDGLVIRSVLKLTSSQAKEGGFFDVETLGGVATVFVDAGAKTGDAATVSGAGLPAAPGEPSGPRGDHVARVEVTEETEETEETPLETKRENRSSEYSDELPELPERGDDGDDVDARDAKRRKSEAPLAAAPDATDLAALLAAKKRALIAALEAKAAGGSGGG
jgi:DnaJ-class molecular chaperone